MVSLRSHDRIKTLIRKFLDIYGNKPSNRDIDDLITFLIVQERFALEPQTIKAFIKKEQQFKRSIQTWEKMRDQLQKNG